MPKQGVEVLTLHPMIRNVLGVVDLRRVEVLAVDGGEVVDLVLHNHPLSGERRRHGVSDAA